MYSFPTSQGADILRILSWRSKKTNPTVTRPGGNNANAPGANPAPGGNNGNPGGDNANAGGNNANAGGNNANAPAPEHGWKTITYPTHSSVFRKFSAIYWLH
jgi:hypothetical protein